MQNCLRPQTILKLDLKFQIDEFSEVCFGNILLDKSKNLLKQNLLKIIWSIRTGSKPVKSGYIRFSRKRLFPDFFAFLTYFDLSLCATLLFSLRKRLELVFLKHFSCCSKISFFKPDLCWNSTYLVSKESLDTGHYDSRLIWS